MSDPRSLLDRESRRFIQPDGAFERLVRRRDRRRRNERVAAGVVGIAVFASTVWFSTGGDFDRTQTPAVPGPTETGPTYAEPTYTLGSVTEEDIVVGELFRDAWVEGDGEAAAAMISPEGTFDGFQPAILPALHDWFRAGGWTFGMGGCGIHGWGPKRGVVGCDFPYENDLTRAVGMRPGSMTISFTVDGGTIDAAWFGAGGDVVYNPFRSPNPGSSPLGKRWSSPPVWGAFIEWISSGHPDDFARMYDPDRSYPLLDPTSIELWERYTDEFVASPEARSLAESMGNPSFYAAPWTVTPGYEGLPPEGAVPSAPESGELVASFAEMHVGLVYVYADGRVILYADIESSFPFGEYQLLELHLSPAGVDMVRSGAVEPSDFLFDVESLPADAWADFEIRPYVPSRYAVCYYQESGDANPGTINDGYEYPSRVVDFFPPPAQAILRGELTHGTTAPWGDTEGPECSAVTTDEARVLEAILWDDRGVFDAEGEEVARETSPILPHGTRFTWGG